MNPWPVYNFLKVLSGMEGKPNKERMHQELERILTMTSEEMYEGCAEFSIMFSKNIT